MERNEGELSEVEGVVKTSEPEPSINGHDKEESGAEMERTSQKIDVVMAAAEKYLVI